MIGKRVAWLLLATGMTGVAPAMAQQTSGQTPTERATTPAPTQGEPAAPAQAPAPADAANAAGDVVVTGSRVIQNGNNSPMPLTVVNAQSLLETQPTTVAAALQNLPVFQGSLGQGTGTGGSNGGPNGTANAVNIRNLGLFRTLVLFDGHRLQSTANVGLVTIDLVPQMLLQRVDIVTGGVSAVYGSDAISGVVNFITDRKFNGISLKAQSGISDRGDDPIKELGIAVGRDLFGGRGHIEASAEYYDDPGIFDMFARRNGQLYALEGANPAAVSSTGAQTIAAGTAGNPYLLYSNVRIASTSFGGLIRSGPLAGQTFNANGVLSPFTAGTPTGTAGFQVGGDGGYYFNSSLKGALTARRAFGRFDFDVTDDVHFYVEALGASNTNIYQNQSLSFTNVTLSNRNAFLPLAYQALLPATGTFTLSKIPQQLGPNRSTYDLFSYQVDGGLQGSFGGGWKWDVAGSHGYSLQRGTQANNINFQKLSAALDAVVSPTTGQIVCNVSVTNPGLYPGCVPLNVFGPTSESAEVLAYIRDQTQTRAYTTLDEVTASVTGAPFRTWAGPVTVALSGEYRKTRFYTNTQIPPTDLQNCTGLRYNCTATSALHQITFALVQPVSQSVKEMAFEAEVPLVRDVPLLREVNLNGAVRYASYDTSGDAWTWKAGIDWHVTDDLRIRATRSRDFRAPNLNDLYAATTISRANVIDQLTGATLVNQTFATTGNPNLKPEVGNTITAGIVYKPGWLRGFSISADFFDIDITDAISAINGTNVSVQRQCNASGGTSPLCALIVRPLPYTNTTTANNATFFYNLPVNAARLHSRGVDFEGNYATRVFRHPFSVRVLATWQPELSQDLPGLSSYDVSGTAYSPAGLGTTPAWRVTGFVNFSPADTVRLTLTERWRSSLRWNADPTLYYANPDIPSFGWTNLNISYTPKSGRVHSEFYVNVQNLFDQQSPLATSAMANPGVFGAYISTDDYIGRYFTAGVRIKL